MSRQAAAMRRFGLLSVLLAGLAATGLPEAAPAGELRHGLSIFGELKYGADFQHFDYVDPAAPKGGEFRSWQVETYDTLNPFILKGVAPITISESFGIEQTFAALMMPAADEPDAAYGYVAAGAERDPAGRWVAFELRPEARFHDGSPITAEDVAYTFALLKEQGHPRYRLLLRDVAGAVAEGPRRVRFDFADGFTRDLPLLVATLPILSKASLANREFTESTLEPLLGSGPYKVDQVDPGRSISYRRVADWWGRDLPVNRGRYNFDVIRYDYYRDRDIALEAFFAGAYDWREEFTSRSWATAYDRPPVHSGRILRLTLPDHTPSGFQAFFFNLRRDKFHDRRVRTALDLAFDFEWTNRNLFYGLYERSNSIFENSDLAAAGPPSPAELALLEPLRGQVPAEVFGPPFVPPATDGSGMPREQLRTAGRLLAEAGWQVIDGGLRRSPGGEPLRIEFLLFEPSFQRIIGPYARNLERLGIAVEIRTVDPAQYQNRIRDFDFDVTTRRYGMPLTPGVEQRNYWGSAAADVPGSLNLAGIRDPAVDRLVETLLGAGDREALTAAARALDRVVMWNRYMVPQWYKGVHHLAFWDKFGRPAVQPRFGLGVVDTWWVDPAKAARSR